MRHQYAILAGLVCAMIFYNLAASHRISVVAAGIDRLDDQRRIAEQVLYEFDAANQELHEHQIQIDQVGQIDSKIDVSAVLAELSHLVTGRVILGRLDLISEPIASAKEKDRNGTTARLVAASAGGKGPSAGDVRFRIVMSGVAANPADVGALACRLEESPYFKQVYPSVSRSGNIEKAGVAATDGPARESLQVSEFEITCYLANYEDIQGR
jgi:hypothetical protein